MARIGLWKMLATLAAFGLALPLMGCSDNGHLGNTLNLSGQVYTADGERGTTATLLPFTGNMAITSNLAGVTGAITNGQMSFEAGRPGNLGPLNVIFGGATINPSSARGTALEMFGGNTQIVRSYHSEDPRTDTFTMVMVLYVFVDREVTISQDAETEVWGRFSETTNAFNITLREGWNAVHYKMVITNLNLVGTEPSHQTHTFSLGDPGNLRWLMGDFSL